MSQYACSPTNSAPLPCASKKLDFYQVLTGVLLIAFIFGHLLLVSSVLLSPKLLNWIAVILEETYIAQFMGPFIFLLILVHFVIAARKMPFRQGELITFWRHAKSMRHWETWAWLVQIITALIIIAFAFTHVYQVMADLPITAAKSAARVQAAGGTCFYVTLLLAAWLHVGIGIFRIGVKYGYVTAALRKKFTKYLIIVVLACIFLGFMTEIRFSTIAL